MDENYWFVDAMNVIGARPDGWWRDRDGAARRLVEAVQAWAARAGAQTTVVLDGGPAELDGEVRTVTTVVAAGRGPDAADDEIVRLLSARDDPERAIVVTSDATLAGRVRALGARVQGAGAFRRELGY